MQAHLTIPATTSPLPIEVHHFQRFTTTFLPQVSFLQMISTQVLPHCLVTMTICSRPTTIETLLPWCARCRPWFFFLCIVDSPRITTEHITAVRRTEPARTTTVVTLPSLSSSCHLRCFVPVTIREAITRSYSSSFPCHTALHPNLHHRDIGHTTSLS